MRAGSGLTVHGLFASQMGQGCWRGLGSSDTSSNRKKAPPWLTRSSLHSRRRMVTCSSSRR